MPRCMSCKTKAMMMPEFLQLEFMRLALYAGLLTGLICGIIGSLVVVNRLVFIAGGIAHAAYGGLGIAFWLGFPPAAGAGLFALGVSWAVGEISFRDRQRIDVSIGILWAAGMALGTVFIDLTPGYSSDLMSYLFGSILLVSSADLLLMAAAALALVLLVFFLYHRLLAVSFDEVQAYLLGIRVKLMFQLLLAMTAVAVVVSIRLVGLILVMALLSIPPYIAEKHVNSLWGMMVLSSLLGIFFIVFGLLLSFLLNLGSGAMIILLAALFFTIHQVFYLRSGKKLGMNSGLN